MAKTALHPLDSFDFLTTDTLLPVTDDPGSHAKGVSENGLEHAAWGEDGPEWVDLAPDSTVVDNVPFEFDPLNKARSVIQFHNDLYDDEPLPSGYSGPSVIELDYFEQAKGGKPGPPQRNSDPELAPEPTSSTTYVSGGESPFNIKLNFSGDGFDQTLKDIFIGVADYFSSVITADLQDVTYQGVFYDDITIDASIVDIDGTGGVLGRAGATLIRGGGSDDPYLPLAGIMEFDSADVGAYLNDGLFDDIVFHEMTHVLGFSQTVWQYMELFESHVDDRGTRRPVDDIIDYRFLGENATSEYISYYGGDTSNFYGVPLETTGGSGTAGSHWDEDRFGNEIMTGYINDPNYQGNITLAALDDMGYTVLDYTVDYL